MKYKKIILAILSYIVITFVLAPVWHILLFGEDYQKTGLYVGEPNYAIGFTTIIIQSTILSFGFHYLFLRLKISAFKFVLFVGVFLWTMQVLAIIAKHKMPNSLWFFAMESFFIILQLSLFAVLLKLIYKNK